MNTWITNHKKMAVSLLLFLSMLAVAAATGIFLVAMTREAEHYYREAVTQYGPLHRGITEEGTVSVGSVEQEFDLDISGYSVENKGFSFAGPAAAPAGSHSGGSRLLEVEEVYITQGQQIGKGAALLKLTDESVEEIRKELVADEEEAKLKLDQLSLSGQKEAAAAAQIREQNRLYGESASLEYEESLQDLSEAAQEAQETWEEAQQELQEYRTDLANVQADYKEAVSYLQEATAAVEGETDTYWHLRNEELREEAKKVVEEEEARTEELEALIQEKEWEIISLQAAYHEAQLAYLEGEADAGTVYDKRLYNLQQAEEIYAIATDQTEYEKKTAQEDYEEASGKLEDFDSTIVDGVVPSRYEGVVTDVSIKGGDTIQKGTTLVSMNDYGDVTVQTEADHEVIQTIAVGETVHLSFPAYPDGEFDGVVTEIGEAVSGSGTQITWPVEIAVDGEVAALYGGMTAEVTFMTEETKDVLYVPVRAVIQENGSSYVKVYDEQGKVVKKEVKTGFSDGRHVEISEGVTEGETVLMESRVRSE